MFCVALETSLSVHHDAGHKLRSMAVWIHLYDTFQRALKAAKAGFSWRCLRAIGFFLLNFIRPK